MHMINTNTYYVIIEVLIPSPEYSSAKSYSLFLLVDISTGKFISAHFSFDDVKKALLKLTNNHNAVISNNIKYKFKYEQSTKGTNVSKLKPTNVAAKLHLHYLEINNRLHDLNILKIVIEKFILHGNIAKSISESLITNNQDLNNQ